uniref:Uncharacterized protein n=1 Tax=Oryza sativa subsp. japonica TaxID=39947 RepID=Q6H7Y9_ORYSJ|nr:hypothetical protein [Oryza sativa Japonica Group]
MGRRGLHSLQGPAHLSLLASLSLKFPVGEETQAEAEAETPLSTIFSPPAENLLSAPVVFLACVLLFIHSCPSCP